MIIVAGTDINSITVVIIEEQLINRPRRGFIASEFLFRQQLF